MSSGDKNLVMNPLERALSTDINRLQSFGQAAMSEMLRALINTVMGTDDVQAGAQYTPNTTQGSPSAGEIFSGLLFAPTGGSITASVGPGVVGMYDPDSSPSADDSQYKLVEDPGTVTATLSLTPNSSGALRIDVVECARVQPDTIIETDSRDVYVPTSGTFTAITVNKVAQAQLQYRIRTGTPGGGFPGTATGWLPLAVTSVPTGTTVWDTVTIWDVRPLLEDRLFSMTTATRDMPLVTRCLAQIDAANTASQSRLTGNIEVQLLARRYGGIMQPSTPQSASGTPDGLFIDLDDASNRSANGTGTYTTGLNYVYLAAPFNLPRWAKYTNGPSGRLPRSPRGVVIASSTPPDYAYGTPHGALSLPPCFQDTGITQTCATNRAVCVLARNGTASSSPPGNMIASGGKHDQNNNPPNTNSSTASSSAVTFILSPGFDFPAHARAIWVELYGLFNISGSVTSFFIGIGNLTIKPGVPGSAPTCNVALSNVPVLYGLPLSGSPDYVNTSPGFVNQQAVLVRIPVPSYYELIGTPGTSTPGNSQTWLLSWGPNFNAAGGGSIAFATSPGGQVATVVAWELMDSGG
jgi:hypothetical protein